jgi:hypothetical protein
MGGVLPQMNNANASNVVTYNGYALGVSTLLVGDGLPVKFVDVYDSVDPYLDFASTAVQNCPASTAAGLHPNDCGHNKLFDVFSTSIKPTTIIPLNQSAPTTANLWNWNPTANTGQAASMPGGDVYYYASNAVGGVTFGQLSLTATESGSHPMGYALNIFSGGNLNNTGTSLCYTTAANVGLNGLYCNFDVYQGTLYTLPTSTSDATSTSNLYGGKQVFRTRSWSGSAAANEDYTLQTSPSANGSGADVYFTIKNSTATTTGAKGLWVQNTGNHGWKLEAGNSSYDATLDTTAMTGAATIQPPAGWTGTVSLQAGLNLPNGTPTYAAGTGVTSVGCASGYSCTNTRGELTIVGGSATTGTIATVNFSAALAAAPGLCQVTQNGGTTFFGIGEGQPTSTAFTVTAGNSVASSTVTVDYRCTP